MTLETATLFCSRCGRETAINDGLLARLQKHHALAVPLQTVADVLPLLSSLRCSACGVHSPVLRAYVPTDLYPFTAADLTRCCLSCGDTLSVNRIAAMPWSDICVPCLESSENAPTPPAPVLAVCKRCGSKMLLRRTKHVLPTRYFLGCSTYPSCTYTQSMPDPD